DAGLRWLGDAVALSEALARAHPDDWALRYDMALPILFQCRALLDAGRTAAARAACARSLAAYDEVAAAHPEGAARARIHRLRPLVVLGNAELPPERSTRRAGPWPRRSRSSTICTAPTRTSPASAHAPRCSRVGSRLPAAMPRRPSRRWSPRRRLAVA